MSFLTSRGSFSVPFSAPDPSPSSSLARLGPSQENESACQSQLNKFPLVVQTPLLQRRVTELNDKLKEIDAAKAIFSRARVRIKSRGGGG